MPNIQIWTARAHRLLAPIMKAIGDLHHQGKSCLMLVPEQFTLQAEREILARLRLQGLFHIEVLSPSRLGERILATAGGDERIPLGASGQQMAVSRVLEGCENTLTYYRSSIHRRGFVEKATSLFSDLKRSGLSAEEFSTYAATASPSAEKLHDIAIIYEAYEQLLRTRFADEDDRTRFIASRLPQSDLINDKHVFVYGFDTLPESLTFLLLAIGSLCQQLVVSLVCDAASAPDGDIYSPIRQSIARFVSKWDALGISANVCPLKEDLLPAPPAIRHLDIALFARNPLLFKENDPCVFLSQHQSPFEEATLATRQIMRLVAEGMNIENITILYPEENGYEFTVSAALGDSGLPFYTDRKLPATSHGLVRFLLSSLRAMATNWRNEDMLNMLSSGYAPLSFEECCTLQNYCLAYGIDRTRWTKPFTKGEPEYKDICETLRQRLMQPLQETRAALVAARDTQASLSAVFQLLLDVHAYEHLQEEEEALLREGLLRRANQNSQVWGALLSTLEDLHALCDDARIPLKHIATRLECGFSAISLASLPPATQMLHAGTLGHSLSINMEAVFILGLNDGILTRSTQSLLSPQERTHAELKTGAYLGLTDESRTLFARLDLKRAMTLPTRFLFLSYAKTNPDGTALRPLSLLEPLQKYILGILPQSPVPCSLLPLSTTQAFAELCFILRSYVDGASLPERWKELLIILLSNPHTAHKTMQLLQASTHRVQAMSLSPQKAQALFGVDVLSVSRLERFADCPFMHFVEYGLRPQITKGWKVEPLDTGNFYHDSLNCFALLAKQNKAFPHIPDNEAVALADLAVEPLLKNLMEGPMGDGAQSQALFMRARQTVRRAAVTITHHLAAGQFELMETEATFGYPGGMPPILLTLQNGQQVMLRGKIDRIDQYKEGDSLYLRVIDYKSSRQDLEASRTWWGLQLQLLLYLDACVSAHPGALPAGAFYFYVADPLVETNADIQASAEDKLRQLLQLRGITLADVEVIRAMDGQDIPVALPSLLDKNGDVKQTAKVLTLDQLTALLSHAKQMATEMSEGIFSGIVDISPIEDGTRTACDFCSFNFICGFDSTSEEENYRHIPPMDMQELRHRLSPQTHQEEDVSC